MCEVETKRGGGTQKDLEEAEVGCFTVILLGCDYDFKFHCSWGNKSFP